MKRIARSAVALVMLVLAPIATKGQDRATSQERGTPANGELVLVLERDGEGVVLQESVSDTVLAHIPLRQASPAVLRGVARAALRMLAVPGPQGCRPLEAQYVRSTSPEGSWSRVLARLLNSEPEELVGLDGSHQILRVPMNWGGGVAYDAEAPTPCGVRERGPEGG